MYVFVTYLSSVTMVNDAGEKMFQPGALVDVGEDESRFFPGQLLGGSDEIGQEELSFIAGQMGTDPTTGKQAFVPGQVINGKFIHGQTMDLGPGGEKVFVQGEVRVMPIQVQLNLPAPFT